MKLTVLGPHGGELLGCKSTCFLLDERLAIDAGALTSTLDLAALSRIDDILLTHSHFDHIKDLPLMSDMVIGRRDSPIHVYSNTECIAALRAHLFNNILWPDFTKIPSRKNPLFRLKSFRPRSKFKIGRYSVTAVPVSHPVESCGYVLADGRSAMAISGDTGPTDAFWELVNSVKNLKLLLIECSFPNQLQTLADISGHLTPRSLEGELQKFDRRGCEVVLYHLKPPFVLQLRKEVQHLPVRVSELGDVFEF